MKQALLKARSMWIEGNHLHSCFADAAIRNDGWRLMQRAKRIVLGVEERKDKKLVLAIMDKHNITKHEVDGFVAVKKPKDETESLKVVAKADYEGDPEDLE